MLVRKKVLLIFLVLSVSVILYTILYFHATPVWKSSKMPDHLNDVSSYFSVARRTLGVAIARPQTENSNHKGQTSVGNTNNSSHLSSKINSMNSTLTTYHGTVQPESKKVTTRNDSSAETELHTENIKTSNPVPSINETNLTEPGKPEEHSASTMNSKVSAERLTVSNSSDQGLVTTSANSSESGTAPSKPRTWPKNSFCFDFLENTFRQTLMVCSNEPTANHSVMCYGNSHSEHMATCTLKNLAVDLTVLAKAVYNPDSVQFQIDDSLALIKDQPLKCTRPTTSNLRSKVESGDFILKFLEKASDTNQVTSDACQKWINETVYFYTAHPRHIYFHFLDLYNLHKLLTLRGEEPGTFKIIRISTSDDYVFGEFDKRVFPEIAHIDELPEVRTCFREIVLVPKSYASVLFQCKMHWSLKKDCMNCDGIGLDGTSFNSFRSRVVRACSLDDQIPRRNSSLVLISRTPYLRDPQDKPEKFERLLSNEDELVSSIQKKYPTANVSAVHFEKYPFCEQVRLANEANVLLGVHGAGLVHLWWLRDDAMAFEMEPYFEVGNPSFKVLSKITGRHYYSDYIGGGWQTVNVEINSVLDVLDKHASVP